MHSSSPARETSPIIAPTPSLHPSATAEAADPQPALESALAAGYKANAAQHEEVQAEFEHLVSDMMSL